MSPRGFTSNRIVPTVVMENKLSGSFRTPFFARYLNLRLSLLLMTVALVAGGSFIPYSPVARAQEKRLRMEEDLQKVFSTHEEVRLDPVMAQREVKTTGRLSLTSFSHRFDLQLQSNDLRAPNSRAEEVVNGIAHDLPRGEANTFKGTVAGLPNTDARFTIDGSHVEGMTLTPDATYFIEPAQKYSRTADSSDYLLYTAADVQSGLTAVCGDTLARK